MYIYIKLMMWTLWTSCHGLYLHHDNVIFNIHFYARVKIKMLKYCTFLSVILCCVFKVCTHRCFVLKCPSVHLFSVISSISQSFDCGFTIMVFFHKPRQNSKLHDCVVYYFHMCQGNKHVNMRCWRCSVFDCCLIDSKHWSFTAEQRVLCSYFSTQPH